MNDYTDAAEKWSGWWHEHPEYGATLSEPSYIDSTERMIEFCPTDIDSFCELGVGNGRNISMFHDQFPHWEYRGNDIYSNIKEIIKQHYPDVLDYAQIDIVDSLQYLNDCPTADIFFMHGHLMHIPPSAIEELCTSMVKKANKYIYLHEATPSTLGSGMMKRRCARYERVYSKLFPGFMSLVTWKEWAEGHPFKYGVWLLKKSPQNQE